LRKKNRSARNHANIFNGVAGKCLHAIICGRLQQKSSISVTVSIVSKTKAVSSQAILLNKMPRAMSRSLADAFEFLSNRRGEGWTDGRGQ
jgi:hypothetical protein